MKPADHMHADWGSADMSQSKRETPARPADRGNASYDTEQRTGWKRKVISAASDVILEVVIDTLLVLIFGVTTYVITWFYSEINLTGADLFLSILVRGLMAVGTAVAFIRYVWRVHVHLKRRRQSD